MPGTRAFPAASTPVQLYLQNVSSTERGTTVGGLGVPWLSSPVQLPSRQPQRPSPSPSRSPTRRIRHSNAILRTVVCPDLGRGAQSHVDLPDVDRHGWVPPGYTGMDRFGWIQPRALHHDCACALIWNACLCGTTRRVRLSHMPNIGARGTTHSDPEARSVRIGTCNCTWVSHGRGHLSNHPAVGTAMHWAVRSMRHRTDHRRQAGVEAGV